MVYGFCAGTSAEGTKNRPNSGRAEVRFFLGFLGAGWVPRDLAAPDYCRKLAIKRFLWRSSSSADTGSGAVRSAAS